MMKQNNEKSKNLTPLADFCERRKISRRELSEIAGGADNGASKSQIQRLIKGQLSDDDTAKLRRILAKNLPQFLSLRGLSIPQINEELTKIFDKGVFV